MEAKTIQQQYELYLKRMGFKSESILHPEQRKQLKEAFYGAWSQLLFFMRDELSELPEDDAVVVLEELKQEASAFWLQEGNQTN